MRRSIKATDARKIAPAATLILLLLPASAVCAQVVSPVPPKSTTGTAPSPPPKHAIDFAITYTAEHANPVGGGGNFWLQGAGVETGFSLWRGLGVAGNLTVTQSSSIGPQKVPLGLGVLTIGPRYRWNVPARFSPKGKPTSVFGEAMTGRVKGFNSIFPTKTTATSMAFALATQVSAGFDVQLNQRISLRPGQISWVRTQLPNSTSNVQNDLRLSAGIVLR